MLEALKFFSISFTCDDTMCSTVNGVLCEEDMYRGIYVEEYHIVQTKMVANSSEESQSIITDSNLNVPVNIQRNDADAKAKYPLLLPPVSQIRQVFEMVEGLAYRCDVSDAMCFLPKLKEVFL